MIALTQGDPAGVGPEIALGALSSGWPERALPLLVFERSVLEHYRSAFPSLPWSELETLEGTSARPKSSPWALLDVGTESRRLEPGRPTPADAVGALRAVDTSAELAHTGVVDAVVTGPVNKAEIALHAHSRFRGHTEHFAARAGLEQYGRDYLMAFLSDRLRVALLSTHVPLRQALEEITAASIADALGCLGRHVTGTVAVAGFNPHAGEGGLLGAEDAEIVAPAVRRARELGVCCVGPLSADTLFARAATGEFDWVLALYHDQGLIAVKTLGFGEATNVTLGLPYVRTSVDHGTAYELAGRGEARVESFSRALRDAVRLSEGGAEHLRST